MASTAELKKIKEQRKALLEQERQLAAELNEGKEERKAASKTQAEARKAILEEKANLFLCVCHLATCKTLPL